MLRTISDKKSLLFFFIPLLLALGLVWVWLQSLSTDKPLAVPSVGENTHKANPISSVDGDAISVPISDLESAAPATSGAGVPTVPLPTAAQNTLTGLSSAAEQNSDELLRDIQSMNQDLEALLSADDLETSLQARTAQDIEAEALALIQQVNAELGVDSVLIADDLFEQTSGNISDPALQQVIAKGDEIEEEIATIAQSLQ